MQRNKHKQKASEKPGPDRTRLREGLLLFAFLLLLAVGVVTVLIPQLGEQPASDTAPKEAPQ